MKLYVASSWRNLEQPTVVACLRDWGFEVYDFKNPRPGEHGFNWRDIDPDWQRWSPQKFSGALDHPIARAGYESDFLAMDQADGCVLVLPCGRSAHLEAGWFCGRGRPVWIYIPHGGHTYNDSPCASCGDMHGCHGGVEPELMYAMANGIYCDLKEIRKAIQHHILESSYEINGGYRT